MKGSREIRCYDYVNQPYDKVRDALGADALEIFQAATKVASSRAESVASELRVSIGGVEVGADIVISVQRVDERPDVPGETPRSCVHLQWQAAKNPRLFPFMNAKLFLYPLTATETQLDFQGEYEPPLGVFGKAVNAVVGHRIAESSVHGFLKGGPCLP